MSSYVLFLLLILLVACSDVAECDVPPGENHTIADTSLMQRCYMQVFISYSIGLKVMYEWPSFRLSYVVLLTVFLEYCPLVYLQ